MTSCEVCGNEFVAPTKYNQAKTCSKECRYALSAQRNREKQGAHYLGKTCPQCGEKFDGKSTFCGRVCSNKYRSGERHPRSNRVFPACKVCGEPTQHTQRATCPDHRRSHKKREEAICPCGNVTGSFTRLYCSEEHRGEYGKKKPPPRMVTHTCIGCGEDFQRPHFYPGKLKYCSNKCSHREVKSVRDKFILDLNDKAIVFHSMWEVRFVAACERFDIPWRRYDGPDIQTPAGVYRPDFIINDDTVVDVKGWLRPESAVKVSSADVLVIDKESLLAFEQDGIIDPLLREGVFVCDGPVDHP